MLKKRVFRSFKNRIIIHISISKEDKRKETMSMILAIILVIAVVLVFWFISTSNTVNRAVVKIDEAGSGIEIQLKKRFDVLTQSMEIAKGFAKHETEVFTDLRKITSGMTVDEMNEAIDNQSKAMKSLFALGEAYPELKSSELFSNLQVQLTEENAQFAASKRAFNANITYLNNLIVSFPTSIVCSIKGQQKREFLHEDNIDAMKNINLSW